MSDAVRQLKEKELNDLIQRRNDFEQVAQQDLQKRYNELLAPIIDKAKAANMPLYQMLGGSRRRIPAYAGGISMGFQEPASLLDEAREYVERGYKAVKLKG